MKKLSLIIGMIAASSLLSSCLKRAFDNPPDSTQYDPNIPVNVTIKQLSDMTVNMVAGQYRTMGDSTIYGVVTADDRTGNFYKQIVIQDSTGGIVISIAATNIYTDFPIGRKVYVKLKGLTIINYKGLPEIGLSASAATGAITLTGLSTTLMNNYIIKASFPNAVVPVKVRITDLYSNSNFYLNRLVELENMEFATAYAGVPYAASSAISTATSLTIQDCPYTGSLVMYNSGYATWASGITSKGSGTIVGIYSVYNSPQFLIRDTSDVQLTSPRTCP